MRLGETFQATGSNTSIFLVGRNSRGQWIARDQNGLRGGLFISRAEAFKFARFENGNRPDLVIAVPGILELDLTGPAAPELDYRRAA
ncbi:MAG: hypothetical protein AB7S93_12640 [Xanthobacteraceae bacterium]